MPLRQQGSPKASTSRDFLLASQPPTLVQLKRRVVWLGAVGLLLFVLIFVYFRPLVHRDSTPSAALSAALIAGALFLMPATSLGLCIASSYLLFPRALRASRLRALLIVYGGSALLTPLLLAAYFLLPQLPTLIREILTWSASLTLILHVTSVAAAFPGGAGWYDPRIRRRDPVQQVLKGALCWNCRYDMAGSEFEICPECGGAIPCLPPRRREVRDA